MNPSASFAVIGGSGLYGMKELKDTQEYYPETPFGRPSAPILVGTIAGHQIAFLARHGIGHHIIPSQVNYRANIYALKSLGVERIVSISACGSLREDFSPGEIVVPDGLFDFTKDRARTFFGDGLVAHINIADPFCPQLSEYVFTASQEAGAKVHRGGAFITIEGPRFSTRTESNVFRAWGMSLIGMTTSPEAYLAREAEMCYAVMAHVTDYDVWHVSEQSVTVEMVIEILYRNTDLAQASVIKMLEQFSTKRECKCGSALSDAIITRPDVIPEATRERLTLLVDKYLD